MFRVLPALTCLTVIGVSISTTAIAQEVPKFTQFPAKIYSGQIGRLNFSTPHAYSYRTRLREASQLPVNFGGRYQVALWGCGTDCATGAFVDAPTGRVTFLPTVNTYEMRDIVDDRFKSIDYRLESRLLVFAGQLNEAGVSGWHFYAVDHGALRHIMTKPYSGNSSLSTKEARERATAKEEEERLASAQRAERLRLDDEQRRKRETADKALTLVKDRMHECFSREVGSLVKSGEASDVIASAIMTICSTQVDSSIRAFLESF